MLAYGQAVIDVSASGALLGYGLIGGLLPLACYNASSISAAAAILTLAAVVVAGAILEWRRPHVLVLNVYQLGTFEVYGVPSAALPSLDDFIASR